MARPQLYINVSQTIAVATAAVAVLSYIFNINHFRTDLNDTITRSRTVTYRR